MLTENQVEAYKQDGYLKVERLFTPKKIFQPAFKKESESDGEIRSGNR